ncbi:MAG TPA: ACP S-malonyltransferase [Polyangiaceae bacterium]|jgi:[acyl-carrier-protein] S-malonyltransferase|nr:ACP S-malonyltransferase [Polyangiaceae bacterium]
MSIAWLFPGQGSQAVGMGKDLLAASPAARAVFERADAVLGEPLSQTILEGPEEMLTLTANAQPALLTMSQALLAALREQFPALPPPVLAAGHSLGEYSALVAAGALSFEDALRLVRARGAAMQNAVAAGVGAMSAVLGVTPDRLEAICADVAEGEIVAPANFNAPGQIVISGHTAAVARAAAQIVAEKGRVIPLKVSAPFHCALMKPAAIALAGKLETCEVRALQFPVVANFDAVPNADASRVKGLLVAQVAGPVRWEASVLQMAAQGVTHVIEIGPGKVLTGLVRRIARDLKTLNVSDAQSLALASAFVAEAAA